MYEALKEQQKQTGSLIEPGMDRDRTIFDIYTKGKSKLFAGIFFKNRQNIAQSHGKTSFKRKDTSQEA
jgi:hypothetical protein